MTPSSGATPAMSVLCGGALREILHELSKAYTQVRGGEVSAEFATSASIGDRIPASQTAEYPIQESVTSFDRSKTEVPYHFTGSVDLGLVQVPIDLTGTLKFDEKKSTHKKHHKSED